MSLSNLIFVRHVQRKCFTPPSTTPALFLLCLPPVIRTKPTCLSTGKGIERSSEYNTSSPSTLSSISDDSESTTAALTPCLVKLWRSVRLGCVHPTNTTTPAIDQQSSSSAGQDLPDDDAIDDDQQSICPCANKRIVPVSLVTILLDQEPCSGCTQIDAIIAVTKAPPPPLPPPPPPLSPLRTTTETTTETSTSNNNSNNNQTHNIVVSRGVELYFIIDASTSELAFMTCWHGETKLVDLLQSLRN